MSYKDMPEELRQHAEEIGAIEPPCVEPWAGYERHLQNLRESEIKLKRLVENKREKTDSKTIEDLMKLARNNPIIHNHFQAYYNGAFPSWEAMLVDLVVRLANTNEEFQQEVLKLHQEKSPLHIC